MEGMTKKNEGRVLFWHNNKKCGLLSEDGKKYYTRREPNHFVVKHSGYGIQESVLDELKLRGVQTIVLTEVLMSGRTIRHEVPVDDWKGPRGVLREQDGMQVFLPARNLPVNRINRERRLEGLEPLGLREKLPERPSVPVDSDYRIAMAKSGVYIDHTGREHQVARMHPRHIINAIRALRTWGARADDVVLTVLTDQAKKHGMVLDEVE